MTDFLLELRSEEIPARMQGKAKEDLARLFGEALAKAGLKAAEVETFATPRRLALIARGLPLATEAVSEEIKGPRSSAPPQALEGFLRKTGLTQDQLVDRDGVYFAVKDVPGRPTASVLSDAVWAIVHGFPWPKSMRWGDQSRTTESLRWVRPLQGIVAIFGEDIVDVNIDGIQSGAVTLGHRFHHPGAITIGGAHDYVEKLRACHVIVHFSERCALIRDGAAKAAADAGLVLVADEGLVAENAGLTEWPVPMLGRFDPAFLEVPEEVIQLTARVNQKYFVCHDTSGRLANAFVCTANIDASDGGAAIVAGNEKVLTARLSDAKFFWEQDLKVPLAVQAEKLSQIVFHEKLGTVSDKVERVAKLARWLVEEGIVKSSPERGGGSRRETEGPLSASHQAAPGPSTGFAGPPTRSGEDLADLAERAARLCKADLVTGMVGEFPELQGVMGGHIARAQGEPDAVADAIRDHYKPVGQGDEVPTAPVTVAVSLADKLDTLLAFFLVNERPTGSKDPYALRRSALGIIALIETNGLRLDIQKLLDGFYENWIGQWRLDDLYVAFFHGWEILETDVGSVRVLKHSPYDHSKHHSQQFSDDPIWLMDLGLFDFHFEDQILERDLNTVRIVELMHFDMFSDLVMAFLADRLKVQQREAGVRHDLIDAVFALGGEPDLVRLLTRVKALQAFVGTHEGANLLAGFKRAIGVIPAKAESGVEVGTPEIPGFAGATEMSLHTALDTAEPAAQAAIAAEDFESAMAALASLRAPIDAFFEGVMVNDEDPDKRAYRMGLLARFRDAVHQVADFSKIEG